MAKDKKTEGSAPKCPITRKQFREKAPASVTVEINGQKFSAMRKEFESGSLGYYLGEKIQVEVDGVPVRLQAGLNLTVVGSKDLPQ